MKRLISRLVLLVVFCSVLFSSPRTCIANTNGPIYIRADGSVDPSTAPISSMDNVTYTFDGNINNSIVVERSNIIIDGNGYTLQGSGLGKAFDLSGVNNVTIKSIDISARNSGRDAHPNYGIYLYSSSFNTISGNNITDNYYAGIYLNESSNNNIIGNNITKNYHGIYLQYSSNNTIVGNSIMNSGFFLPFPPIQIKTSGIKLVFSSDNFLRNNVMADSDFNFGVLGVALSDFVNDVDVSNSVDGKPVYYWVSRRDIEVPLDAGYVALVNCTNVRIENLTLANNMQGILLAYTNYTTIVGNNITNNWNGISLWYSSNYNDLFGNNITANDGVGILFAICSNNTVSGNKITNTIIFGIYLNGSSNNSISGNNITNNQYGIYLLYSSNNNIIGNNITNNSNGIVLWSSSFNNSLSENNITASNEYGISLRLSSNNTLRDNHMSDNQYSFGVYGSELSDYINDMDSSNTVNGKPVCYWVNRHDEVVPDDAGYVAVVNSTGITVKNLELKNNERGILLAYTKNSTITGNNITNNSGNGVVLWSSFGNSVAGNNITNNNGYGIGLGDSSNNTITENNITNNQYGIWLSSSSNNKFYHNNFMENTQQVYFYDSGYPNVWDDDYSSGGNYWNDYTGADVKSGSNQDQSGSDGIGDTAYSINTSNVDRFPLMAPISIFDTGTWNDVPYKVHVISNSTVSNLQLNETEKIISFNVTGEIGVGFCRVTIPNIIIQNMWQGNYAVLVDGEKPLNIKNWTDNTNTYMYFTYLHSEHEVIIIPEFPVAIILPLFMIITLCVVILTKKEDYEFAQTKLRSPARWRDVEASFGFPARFMAA